jgi:hypothetical protein
MMMQTKHPLIRLASASIGTVAIAIAALSFAGPGNAHDPDQTKEHTQVQIHIAKAGENPNAVAVTSGCDGKMDKIDTETPTKDEDGKTVRTRIVMCHMGKKDEASMLSRLQHARKTIADNGSIPTEARNKALAAIDAEIAKLNGGSGLSRQ